MQARDRRSVDGHARPSVFSPSLPRPLAFSILILLLAAAALSVLDCTVRTRPVLAPEEGLASWYGPGFHGKRAADGSRYNQYALTAAHRTLPLGSRVRVTNLDNGRALLVRITDRGPFVDGRIIDLSYGAAKRLKMARAGLTRVRLEVLELGGKGGD